MNIEAAREIGLGSTLYLFTMKCLAYMFLIFVVLNIPLYLIYASGEGPVTSARDPPGNALTALAKLTIGNLGQSDYSCSQFNMAQVGN